MLRSFSRAFLTMHFLVFHTSTCPTDGCRFLALRLEVLWDAAPSHTHRHLSSGSGIAGLERHDCRNRSSGIGATCVPAEPRSARRRRSCFTLQVPTCTVGTRMCEGIQDTKTCGRSVDIVATRHPFPRLAV